VSVQQTLLFFIAEYRTIATFELVDFMGTPKLKSIKRLLSQRTLPDGFARSKYVAIAMIPTYKNTPGFSEHDKPSPSYLASLSRSQSIGGVYFHAGLVHLPQHSRVSTTPSILAQTAKSDELFT
jgi:hypothetical protein